ncbi:hypothetical protein EYC80_004922 [Monilinia laxa]|uniref:Uncharacterized protein n=1 Tax=Monilinia laxa TaxID=61186 RepID=A0A5N6KIT3_MONLA|nr:hypothetical protein EYC80_004922 [Monilinia laxa]
MSNMSNMYPMSFHLTLKKFYLRRISAKSVKPLVFEIIPQCVDRQAVPPARRKPGLAVECTYQYPPKVGTGKAQDSGEEGDVVIHDLKRDT